MKIGIISDTHNHTANLQKAASYFNKNDISLVIHCGDWTSPQTLKALKDLKAPVKGVLGNCDTDSAVYLHQLKYEWPKLKIKLELFEPFLEIQADSRQIAATHGDNEKLLEKLIRSSKYDLVCCGHLHKPLIKKEGKTVVVNPGSLAGFYGRDVRIEILPTFAVYDTQKKVAQLIKLK